MRNGDLSNEIAPSMGLRFEGCIKTAEGKLNKTAKAYLGQLGRNVDVNIIVITTGDRRKALSFLVKWTVPYTRVVQADSLLEIPDIVRENDMIEYWDMDREIVQNVNSRGSGKINSKLWTSVLVS